MKKSKLLENRVRKTPELDSYHTEKCDGKIQHWVSASDGYFFPETETSTVCGFDARELNKIIQGFSRKTN